jgi:archaeal type IV pilus assembly protein PilA
MRHIIREDEDAVSPVIATILMVAITVVLAAVLYVMVSGLITGPGSTPQTMGVSASISSNGQNWVLLVSNTPTGKLYTSVTLSIVRDDGSQNMTATPWSSLSTATNGCSLIKNSASATSVQVGDSILCRTSWYSVGSQYRIVEGSNLLANGKFQ